MKHFGLFIFRNGSLKIDFDLQSTMNSTISASNLLGKSFFNSRMVKIWEKFERLGMDLCLYNAIGSSNSLHKNHLKNRQMFVSFNYSFAVVEWKYSLQWLSGKFVHLFKTSSFVHIWTLLQVSFESGICNLYRG